MKSESFGTMQQGYEGVIRGWDSSMIPGFPSLKIVSPPPVWAPQIRPAASSGSAVAFQRIADAHHVLLDPEKRKAFDEGKAPPRSPRIPTSNDSHCAGNQVIFQKGLVLVWDNDI